MKIQIKLLILPKTIFDFNKQQKGTGFKILTITKMQD